MVACISTMSCLRSGRHLGPAVALTLLLGACSQLQNKPTAGLIDHDYRVRHPIQLVRGAETLDVFPGSLKTGSDRRQQEDIRAFAARWKQRGQGPITAQVPATGPHNLNEIRRLLHAGGASGSMGVVTYHPTDPHVEAPIRLSFPALQARLPHDCGQWPEDLAGGRGLATWQNKQYWNLGCSYQQNLAAQVADPRDLIRPRQETPIDTQKRANAIDNSRGGGGGAGPVDPSTTYNTSPPAIFQGIQ